MSISKRQFKNLIYEQLARIGKTVASPQRLELLDLISQSERTVESLAEETTLSIANTSRHLQILKGARLVVTDKRGLNVYYRLADNSVAELLRSIRLLAENRLTEMDQIRNTFFKERSEFAPVNRETLLKRVKEGELIVLDVRPAEEYETAHIPGAFSIPIAELIRRFSELPKDREIVAYCRGPYCVFSEEAVVELRSLGYHAHRWEEGVHDWKTHGFPLVQGKGRW